MVIAEWLISLAILSLSVLAIGIGSCMFVLTIHVFEDWRTHGKQVKSKR